jgi:hypothetical protein
LLLSSLFPKVSGFERISSISWESLSVSVNLLLDKYPPYLKCFVRKISKLMQCAIASEVRASIISSILSLSNDARVKHSVNKLMNDYLFLRCQIVLQNFE